jgi:hypothetical protein
MVTNHREGRAMAQPKESATNRRNGSQKNGHKSTQGARDGAAKRISVKRREGAHKGQQPTNESATNICLGAMAQQRVWQKRRRWGLMAGSMGSAQRMAGTMG